MSRHESQLGLASQPVYKTSDKISTWLYSDLRVGVSIKLTLTSDLGGTVNFVRWPTSHIQPAVYWPKKTSHLTKCQPDANIRSWGLYLSKCRKFVHFLYRNDEGIDKLLQVMAFLLHHINNWHLSDDQPTSQPAHCNWYQPTKPSDKMSTWL